MSTFRESLRTLFNYRYITLIDPDGNGEVVHTDWLCRYAAALLPEWNDGTTDMGLEANEIDFFLALCMNEIESIEPNPEAPYTITRSDGWTDMVDQIVHLRHSLSH